MTSKSLHKTGVRGYFPPGIVSTVRGTNIWVIDADCYGSINLLQDAAPQWRLTTERNPESTEHEPYQIFQSSQREQREQ